jgi:hypothetical protein
MKDLEITYYLNSDDMTNEEFENQEDKKFTLTKEMIIETIERYVELPINHTVELY